MLPIKTKDISEKNIYISSFAHDPKTSLAYLTDPNDIQNKGKTEGVMVTQNDFGITGKGVTEVFLDTPKTLYTFRIMYTPENQPTVTELLTQLLSTFIFTDQIIPTQNEGKFCGGIAGNLPQNQCPTGYFCKLDGNYPDAGGKCIQQ